MIPTVKYDDRRLFEVLYKVGPNAEKLLEQRLAPLAQQMESDARSRASAHIRFLGSKKPGTYVPSIKGGLAHKKPTRVTGYVRSGHPLAHLMELGFKISDLMIVPGTGKGTTSSLGALMAFAGDAGDVIRAAVHRHQTVVPAYPAIFPAFEAKRNEIMATIESVARDAGKS